MFFKNIDTWSKTKLRIYVIVCNIIYFLFAAIIPIIIVGVKYSIFKKVSGYRISGWGIIFTIIVVVGFVRTLTKVISKLPESTLNEQRVKYTILGVKALIIPFIAIIIMGLFKSDFSLAYNTAFKCVITYTIAVIIEYSTILYLDRELYLRNKAKEQKEINKRMERM